MIEKYQASFKKPAFAHQLVGIERLVSLPFYGLFDEMGAGKSKQVIDAACILFEEKAIDTVLVVAPASVRGVWLNPEFGELVKHAWASSRASEYHSKGLRQSSIFGGPYLDDEEPLQWVVTNYEYIRSEKNLKRLQALLADRKFMMVLDESSFIKSRQAKQTKACLSLAKQAARRVILNGTPITNSPVDLWSQLNFLSPTILPFRNFYAFRATYAVMGGWQGKQIVKWQNLDELQKQVAPYVIRREKKDCLDLPPKTFTQVECPLTESSWEKYKQMRDECIVWLEENPSMAAQAGVKVMRLAQITSGLLGGVEGEDLPTTVDIGREKLDLFAEWLQGRLIEEPGLKVIAWCRFRRQLDRLATEMKKYVRTYKLQGGQSKEDREEAIQAFSRTGSGPGLLCAQQQAGSFGLNLVAASNVVYLSNDFNLATRLQSEDRVHRPGQTRNVLYVDVIATGPKGQRTVDHGILAALRKKHDIASWTVSAWREALREDLA